MSDNTKNYHIGIINTCPIPLQKIAYEKNIRNIPKQYDTLLSKLEAIRENPDIRVKKTKFGTASEMNTLISIIHNRLKSRVESAKLCDGTVIILCGNFASKTWKKCFPNTNFKVLELPHPSMGEWFNPDNINAVLELKSILRTANCELTKT